MSFTVLVLHGPNLRWLGQEAIDEALESRAGALRVALRVVQANGEAGLIDALDERDFDAVVVNPGALGPTAAALAQALALARVAVAVAAFDRAHAVGAFTGVAKHTFTGAGAGPYLKALEAVTAGRPEADDGDDGEGEAGDEAPVRHPVGSPGFFARKTIGRRPPPQVAEAKAPGKTIGRKAPPPAGGGAPGPAETTRLTRAAVREQVAARLSGKLRPEALATWARTQWASLQAGGACEDGAREVLDSVLLTLMAGAKASDDVLLAQMAKL